jgi:nucleotide-binding universal stress UspA family protein
MYRKILCAADFNETCAWAVAEAADIARREGAELLLCHFIASPYKYSRDFVYAEPGSQEQAVMGPEVRRRYEERLRAAYGEKLDGRARLVVASGFPETEILRLARREGADLIVLGRTGLHDGGTGREVLRRARCPVMVMTGSSSFILSGAKASSCRMVAAA